LDAYIDAVVAVHKMAEIYSEHTIESCQNGFLVAVKGQSKALRCVFVHERREIHIVDIIEYSEE
jgi:hypothetical protein